MIGSSHKEATSETSPEKVVSVDGVSFSHGDVPVLKDVSVDIEEGAFLGIVGPNGSGKSTLVEVMLGLRSPDSGSVRLFGRFSEEDRRAVEKAMEEVGLEELSSRRVGRLSGGQRQRVFIARALAAEADLLALDEPTVGVDAESREEFYELLRDLNNGGMTVVLIEHDIGVVTEYADEIACINRRLYFDGDPSEFVETDALAEAYGKDQHVLSHDH